MLVGRQFSQRKWREAESLVMWDQRSRMKDMPGGIRWKTCGPALKVHPECTVMDVRFLDGITDALTGVASRSPAAPMLGYVVGKDTVGMPRAAPILCLSLCP